MRLNNPLSYSSLLFEPSEFHKFSIQAVKNLSISYFSSLQLLLFSELILKFLSTNISPEIHLLD